MIASQKHPKGRTRNSKQAAIQTERIRVPAVVIMNLLKDQILTKRISVLLQFTSI